MGWMLLKLSTLQSDFFKNVQYFCELSQTAKGYLIYTGQQNGSHAKVKLVPINEIDQLTQLLG
jgi:hypothetical protein